MMFYLVSISCLGPARSLSSATRVLRLEKIGRLDGSIELIQCLGDPEKNSSAVSAPVSPESSKVTESMAKMTEFHKNYT
ncbi:hypothetical protein GGR52DRAFT_537871 [Hypoxylon sp. FL1284]|nr:hypothetical protein GGR52DRAFT_537871 [Hypoxylon sp. FL1284]